MELMEHLTQKALKLGVPLSVQLDVTWRCNERCVHCYLDHRDEGELSIAEIRNLLDDLAAAGVFFLTISGGEPLLRRDFFEIAEYARTLQFSLRLKTNATLLDETTVARLRDTDLEQLHVSIYSDDPAVHDSITGREGSFEQSMRAIRLLKAAGVPVWISNVLMRPNVSSAKGVHRLARELGVGFRMDPTITPSFNGDTSLLSLRILPSELAQVFQTEEYVGDVSEFCAPPVLDNKAQAEYPCGAAHTTCYVSPYGDVFPCVQFPLLCGNIRSQSFCEIWRDSPQLAEVRGIRGRDLHQCSGCTHLGSCSRCPGLAYMEGNMRGISTVDCQKAFVRTGVPSIGIKLLTP